MLLFLFYFIVFQHFIYLRNFSYLYFGDGGRPLLLMLKKDDNLDSILNNYISYIPPIVNLNEPIDTINGHKYISFDFCDYADTALNPFPNIFINDSKMGYFQFLVFYLIGNNFGLFWHSNYGGLILICSKKALNEILRIKSDFTDFTSKQKRQARKIELIPKIIMNKDSCLIEILSFNAWEGFVKNKFSINRDCPHSVKYISRDTLVKHNCRIMF